MQPSLGRPSRWNFLRLRLLATAVATGLLLLGLLPWSLFAASLLAAEGAFRVFALLATTVWGIAFLPFLWLGWKALRLAWRPLVTWQPVRVRRVIEIE